MNDDITINKIETIMRCINRIQEEYIGFENKLDQNYTKQGSILLNLEGASPSTIDLSTHIIRINSFGIPKTSRDVFELLNQHSIISKEISEQMKKMVGFRNLAVHDYQNISLDIVKSIVENHLADFEAFVEEILNG